MLGDSVEITEGYRTWWSYIPHFIGTPGYVYAYAYGQLLALSVYAATRSEGDEFVPRYLDLLRAGGSMSPEELGAIVGVDLADPGFWDRGLDIIERRLDDTEAAARGRPPLVPTRRASALRVRSYTTRHALARARDQPGAPEHAEVLGHACRARSEATGERLRVAGAASSRAAARGGGRAGRRAPRRRGGPAPTAGRRRAAGRRAPAATAGRSSPTRAATTKRRGAAAARGRASGTVASSAAGPRAAVVPAHLLVQVGERRAGPARGQPRARGGDVGLEQRRAGGPTTAPPRAPSTRPCGGEPAQPPATGSDSRIRAAGGGRRPGTPTRARARIRSCESARTRRSSPASVGRARSGGGVTKSGRYRPLGDRRVEQREVEAGHALGRDPRPRGVDRVPRRVAQHLPAGRQLEQRRDREPHAREVVGAEHVRITGGSYRRIRSCPNRFAHATAPRTLGGCPPPPSPLPGSRWAPCCARPASPGCSAPRWSGACRPRRSGLVLVLRTRELTGSFAAGGLVAGLNALAVGVDRAAARPARRPPRAGRRCSPAARR